MILLFIIAKILLFIAVITLLEKYDENAGLQIRNKEYVTMGMIFAVVEVILFSFYGYGRDYVCRSLVLYYLTAAALIDYKTRRVYRIGSMAFIAVSAVMLFLNWNGNSYFMAEKLSGILVFSLIVIFGGKHSMMGWGDVLTYIGVFFWLGSLPYGCMTIEVLSVYMLFANLLFFICNIRKFDWKKKAMKEEVAFLPAMTGAALMILWWLNWIKN